MNDGSAASVRPMPDLTADELLSTTRAVRKRLDLERPLPRALLEECVDLALQAPSAGNAQTWSFVVLTDQPAKDAVAHWYRRSFEAFAASAEPVAEPTPAARRAAESAQHLADHLHEVPALVIPCIAGRLDQAGPEGQAAGWGSIVQAAWSFCLAARSRGLGTCWTTLHLTYEREVAEALGIPYAEVTQTCLLPVAHTIGSDFKPGPRRPAADVIRWDRW